MADALHTPGVVSAAEARLDDAGLIAVQGPTALDARTGVLVGPGTTTLVTGTSDTAPMAYLIGPHHWVTNRGVNTDGVYRGTLESATRAATTAAPGTGSRIDVIYAKQGDATSTISADGSTAPIYGCVQGTSTTGTPVKPPIPVGAIELATGTVSAGATATNGAGVVITNTVRQTAARGGIVPVTASDTTAGVYVDQYRGHPTNGLERWDGSKWTTPTPLGQWVTDLNNTTYNATLVVTGTPQALPGLSFTYTVPVGRQLDLDFTIPHLSIGANAGGFIRLFDATSGAVIDGDDPSTGGGASIFTNVKLTGHVAGDGTAHTVVVQGWGVGGTVIVTASTTTGAGVRMRHRIL